ncbi:MAG: sensor histidine kinase [Halanaeroarchaeum sp.]
MPGSARARSLTPAKIAGVYLAFGVLWILASDLLVGWVAGSQRVVTRLQTVKGWLFVGLSTGLFYGLTRAFRAQLDRSRRRLLTSNQRLQVLARVFRHNLRNDLNVIRGYADMAKRSSNEAREDRCLATVDERASRLVTMSEKLRIVDQAEIRPGTDETIDLTAVVREECDRLERGAREADVTTTAPEEARVYADDTIGYAVREALDNAVEHAGGGEGPPHIDVTVETAGDRTVLAISDDGPGLPAGELEAIRSGRETQLVHASGVGLWLIAWLTRLNGGTVDFETDASEGTTVRMAFDRVTRVDRVSSAGPACLPTVE